MGFRDENGTLKHGILDHGSEAEARAYADALAEEREDLVAFTHSHPHVAGKVVNVLCNPLGHYASMDDLATKLIAGEVKQPWVTYCRTVMAWMKKNPDMWRPWHRGFDAAVRRARK